MASENNKVRKIKGYIAVNEKDKTISIKEEFKADIIDVPIRFPKELGAAHPFDFESVEKVYKKNGFVAGIINKYVDSIVGDFSVEVKNPNAQVVVRKFIKNTDFAGVIRTWIRESMIKGNGFIELDLEDQKIRVLNANNIFVKRNSKGKVISYNHCILRMPSGVVNAEWRKVTDFLPNEIAHLKINHIADEPYGLGLIWPNERNIENMVINEQDLQKLISRKAGAPIHVKVGVPGETVNTADIDDFKSKLQFMNNRTEWVTDGNVEMKILDFGQLGKNLADTLRYNVEMLSVGFEVPIVLLGYGNIPEGLAKVQLEAFQRKISSIQDEIETELEEKVFKPLLESNKLSEDIKFIWNLPGENEINERITKITELLKNPFMSDAMKAYLELELSRLLNWENADEILKDPQEAKDEEDKQKEMRDKQLEKVPEQVPEQKPISKERKKEETQIPQPEMPGAKPNAKEIHIEPKIQNELNHIPETLCQKDSMDKIAEMDLQLQEMTIQEFVNLKEYANLNYSDYIISILKRLKTDKFETLKAITEQDMADGLLPETEIEKLRIILKDGFKKNQTIRTIENEIKNNIELKDRLKEGTLMLSSEQRPIVIARTETVRLANEGLIDVYKENKVERVRWLSALSDRTCPDCEALNGQVFDINNITEQPPLHSSCRCSLVAVI